MTSIQMSSRLQAYTKRHDEIPPLLPAHYIPPSMLKAYAITAITETEKTHDTITVGTTLGVKIGVGGFIIEAAAESTASSSALKYTPLALVGTGKPIIQGHNLDTDAWVLGVTKGNPLPECVTKTLTGIINY